MGEADESGRVMLAAEELLRFTGVQSSLGKGVRLAAAFIA